MVRRFSTPEACEVAWDGLRPLALRWRGRRSLVIETLESWCVRSHWWFDPALLGERREYHRIATERGVLEVMAVVAPDGARTWCVNGIWD